MAHDYGSGNGGDKDSKKRIQKMQRQQGARGIKDPSRAGKAAQGSLGGGMRKAGAKKKFVTVTPHKPGKFRAEGSGPSKAQIAFPGGRTVSKKEFRKKLSRTEYAKAESRGAVTKKTAYSAPKSRKKYPVRKKGNY